MPAPFAKSDDPHPALRAAFSRGEKVVIRPTVLALLAMLTACRQAKESGPPAAPPAPIPAVRITSQGAGWPLEVVDSLGRKVVLREPARRVVSLVPSNTEILFAVGAGDRVVGVTMMDDYPPEAKERKSIGGMAPGSVNLETLTALKPDLVLATGGVQQPLVEPLERLGLAVVALDAERPEDVAANIRLVGRLVDRGAEGEALASKFVERLDAVRRRVAARQDRRPKVLYLLYDDPLMTVGPGTFLGRMIEEAGGDNVFGDVSARYPTPSDEEVLVRAPEVVLATFGLMGGGGRPETENQARLLKRPGWRDVPAVRERRIHALDENLTTRVGPRLVEGLESIERALAPPGG
ncbi:ABC transporter substrate-binding protein [Paludisphaera mucosa]|uniref:Cobalamin-binding protein n=1 Tax=Paludisphaera mucosa TaxID=3030827 RepID=A0ABT6FGZ6_9BACT|nr:cobalamin-binding protein [Paludisphaera mucosa]MDG3006858.1 cobalamin-binding protein [Paludisphaera mucosa]